MRLPKFEYLEPKTLKEAAKALASDTKGSVLIAGGTDLLVNMKHRVIQPKQVINLKTIPKLAYISNGKGGLRIGTLTTLHEHRLFSSDSREISPSFVRLPEKLGLMPIRRWAPWVEISARGIGVGSIINPPFGEG